ncbi:sensor histidine kinase [Pseudonocardia sp. CA-142604]|uniref:sensor histidine kinase n=1 Tax=Pseudonocardia sp. CA-142604 TaxID=3240024 RepID=UPI003D908EFD
MHPRKDEDTDVRADFTYERDHPSAKAVRKRLYWVVGIPSVTLLVLWVAVSSYFVVGGVYVRAVAASVREVSIPAVTALAELQKERQLALQYLDNPSLAQSGLAVQQQTTDQKVEALEAAFAATISNAPDEIASQANALRGKLEQLPALRTQIIVRSIDRTQVSGYYNGVLDAAMGLFDTQARVVPDTQAALGGIVATSVFRAAEMLSRETSIVSAAFATGTFSSEDFVRFSQLPGFYRAQLAAATPFLYPEGHGDYEALTTSAVWQRLQSAEGALVTYGPWSGRDRESPPVTAADWQTMTDEVTARLTAIAVDHADRVSAAAIESGDSQLLNAIVGSILALLASIAAIVVAVRVSRSLVDRTSVMARLARLRDDSLDLAHNRLPTIVARLKNGEPVELTDELPQLDQGRDEIGQVAQAFNAAQEAAVNAAMSEAKARSGLRNVFLGIAHRNQILVHRQLQIIGGLERDEANETTLGELFKLDHLATRARRTTENLIILGGEQPGRRWRKPIPLMQVLRSAVSETKEYARVQLERVPDIAVAGAVVADVVHMIAELVDNATSFSPDGSPVTVTSTLVARGVVVEVSDQGLGMKDDARRRANEMMTAAPEFDAMALRADSSLGLFVVARLASRLGIAVTFDPSRFGGLRATVLIPDQHLHIHQDAEEAAHATRADAAPRQEAPTIMQPAPANLRPWPTPAAPEPRPFAPPPPTPPAPSPAVDPVSPAALPAIGAPEQALHRRDDRPRLPQRKPQEHLAAELKEEPDDDSQQQVPRGDRSARTLAAFHEGSLRGRASASDS